MIHDSPISCQAPFRVRSDCIPNLTLPWILLTPGEGAIFQYDLVIAAIAGGQPKLESIYLLFNPVVTNMLQLRVHPQLRLFLPSQLRLQLWLLEMNRASSRTVRMRGSRFVVVIFACRGRP
ncbi:MAG: hypothetical protein M2R45_03335 [Verrucomicrobia subdivision 3 bacterium]|nr:hypothetical protein [Limisphaerales bacterium]MCS1415383.1 hypothetical protein [Limisphaerales bacterium]